MRDGLSNEWLSHLGSESVRFPRDVMYFNRNRRARHGVANPTAYVEKIEAQVSQSDVYAALYSDHSKLHGLADKIYIDIDADKLWDAYDSACSISLVLEDRYGVAPTVYFTGKKGYALYIGFRETQLNYYAIKELVLKLAAEAGCAVDSNPLGDKSRVSRLPYTFNFKTVGKANWPRACVPVDLSWGQDRILQESELPVHLLPVERVESHHLLAELLEISQKLGEEPIVTQRPINIDSANGLVRHLVAVAPKFRDGRHRTLSFLLIPALVATGCTDAEVYSICGEWLSLSGKNPSQYRNHIRASLARTRSGPEHDRKQAWGPWTLDRFLVANPDLMHNFLLETRP